MAGDNKQLRERIVRVAFNRFEPLLSPWLSKLLKPGWAGELSSEELALVRAQLRRSASLRRRWGFRPSARRLSESRIREIAREGLRAIGRPVLASAVKKYRNRTPFSPQSKSVPQQTATKTLQ
jgi:hypothetical protein